MLCDCFTVPSSKHFSNSIASPVLSMSSSDDMSERYLSVDEIKSELTLRNVDFSFCISRDELIDQLIKSRMEGKADVDILNKFSDIDEKVNKENQELSEEALDAAMEDVSGQDGNLPGGLPKELVKALSSDPQIMEMLRDPKTQEMMQAVMSGGPEAMKQYLGDPASMDLLQKLSKAIERVQR